MQDNTYHDDQTINKCYKALIASGLTYAQARDAITSILNNGLLIRERS